MTGSDLPSFLTQDDPSKTPILCPCRHLENIHMLYCRKVFFFPVPIDMFTMPLTFSAVLQAAHKVCLGKILAAALARVALALPCASCRSAGNPASRTMGSGSQPSMVWPFSISAANRCVHTQHQLYFLSPNCLKLPENFLLGKWIKMTTSVSLLHLLGIYKTIWLVQFVKISTMGVHCYFLLAHLMIFHSMLTRKKK